MKKYYLTMVLLFCISINKGITQTELDLEELKEKLLAESPHEKIYDLLGKDFPEQTLNILNETNLTVSDLAGKRTLINFWFTNCQPCLDEIPILNSIKEELGNREYNYIAITFQESSEIKNFLKSIQYNYQHVTDSRDLIDKIGISYYPKTLILDKDLKVVRIEKRMPADANESEIGKWKQDIINSLKTKESSR